MKVAILEIKRGSKSGKVLDVCIKHLVDATSNYIEGRNYRRQISGRQVSSDTVEKKDYKRYDELSKNLEVVYIGFYRQRIYTQYILKVEE